MRTRRIIGLGLLSCLSGLALLATTCGGNNNPPPGGGTTHTVTVGAGGATAFSPSTLTIAVGDTVHWTWSTGGHNVVSGSNATPDGKFCSPSDSGCSNPATSNSGDTYDHKFTTAGTFPYFCKPHSFAGMTGTITVQ